MQISSTSAKHNLGSYFERAGGWTDGRIWETLFMWRLRLVVLCIACCTPPALVGLVLGLLFHGAAVGFAVGLVVGALYWTVAYLAAEKFPLAIYDVVPIERTASPNLYKTIDKLSAQAGIETPTISSIPFGSPNAFALSRGARSPVIVLTNSLMAELENDEVRAILALMVSRIASGDAAACSIAATLAGLPIYSVCHPDVRQFVGKYMKEHPHSGITALEAALLAVVVPPCALALRLAFDRRSLEAADAAAALMVASSVALAAALTKIEGATGSEWWALTPYNPATAVLFAVPPLPPPEWVAEPSPMITRLQRAFTGIVPSVADRRSKLPGIENRFQDVDSLPFREGIGVEALATEEETDAGAESNPSTDDEGVGLDSLVFSDADGIAGYSHLFGVDHGDGEGAAFDEPGYPSEHESSGVSGTPVGQVSGGTKSEDKEAEAVGHIHYE